MNETSIKIHFFDWLRDHYEYDYEIEPDKDSPNWLCSINYDGESFVLCLEKDSLDSYFFIGIAKFPDVVEADLSDISGLLKVCNEINSQFLGGKCEICEESGIGIIIHTSIPTRLFISISEDEKNHFIRDSFVLIKQMIDAFRKEYPNLS